MAPGEHVVDARQPVAVCPFSSLIIRLFRVCYIIFMNLTFVCQSVKMEFYVESPLYGNG